MRNLFLLFCIGATTLQAATPFTYEHKMVASVLVAEAGGEGEKGMTAVAEVIRRRADLKKVSCLAIVQERKQFSSVNRTPLAQLHTVYKDKPLFQKALQIAKNACSKPSRLGNLTKRATHFDRKNRHPYWTHGVKPVAVVGNHAFYILRDIP